MEGETRAVRVARRRKELLEQFHTAFAKFCDEELKNENITPSERLTNAIRKMDLYVYGLTKEKPQETSFYTSVALEWQRLKIAQMEEIQRRRKEREEEISLCPGCFCMTHTIDNKCGKCGGAK